MPGDGTPMGVRVHAGDAGTLEAKRVAADVGADELPTPCTDLGNAERLARRHGADLRWCEDWKAWFVWCGTHWQRDNTQSVTALAKDTVRAIPDEARGQPDSDQWKRLMKHAIVSEGAGRIEAMVKLARAEAGVAVTPDRFDQDGWSLPCANGTIDLRTGQLRPSLRSDLSTRSIAVAWNPAAECPLWLKFLARVQPDAEVRGFLQRWAGYLCTGVIREHVFVILHGTGRNGKGVFVNAIMHVLGAFARQVPTDLLVESHGPKHPVDKMTLRGVRFASASETEQGARLATTVVKALTGGDTMSARGMGENFTEWKPTHKVALQTNPKPVIRESGPAIRDRLLLVPWAVYMQEHERDLDLGKKLEAEAEGILRWLVDGCLAWHRDGLVPPAAVRLATAAYLDDQDSVGQFLTERTTTAPAYEGAALRENATALYQAFVKWCEGQGRKPDTQTAFGSDLETRGFSKDKKGVVWRIGLRLLTEVELAAAARAPDETAEGDLSW